MASSSLWQRFQRYFLEYPQLGFSLDISRMKFPDDLFEKMGPQIERAFGVMLELEAGAIANPTEKRMVGHYWLRNAALAPTPEIRSKIEETIRRIKAFATDVHTGKIAAENGKPFKHLLHIGIGGSALGPQFVSAALDSPEDPMDIFFFDNTDLKTLNYRDVRRHIGMVLQENHIFNESIARNKIRRDKRHTERNARGGSKVCRERTSIRQARYCRDGRRKRTGPTCRSAGMARAFSNAGLDWGAHLCDERGRAAADGAARI